MKLVYSGGTQEPIPILSTLCDKSRWLWWSIWINSKGKLCSSGSVLLLSREIICFLGTTSICNVQLCEELDLSESSEKLSIMAWFKCISHCQNTVLLDIYQIKFIYKTSMSLYTPFTSHKGKCSLLKRMGGKHLCQKKNVFEWIGSLGKTLDMNKLGSH